MSGPSRPELPSGVLAFVKRDCPTCELVAPALAELAKRVGLVVYTQDDPGFPQGVEAVDDSSPELSWRFGIEAVYARGWSDGLPLVPPTEERVFAMLEGTTRAPDETVAVVPPGLVECSIEKVAVNAVMAGCKPGYLPVVLAAVYVPHPIQDRSDDEMREIADGAFEAVVGQLVDRG